MNKKNNFIILLFLIVSISTVLVNVVSGKYSDAELARDLVKGYIESVGNFYLDKGYIFQNYNHPDFELLGGDIEKCLIISDKYKILKVSKVREDQDLDNPHIEDLIAVEVEFKNLGLLVDHKFIRKQYKYSKIFYCSKSTGQYLIINSTDNETLFSFYRPTINWLETQVKTDPGYGSALKKLQLMGKNN